MVIPGLRVMIRWLPRSAALGCLLLACTAGAQGVYKCVADGRTVYQSTPCASQGKTVSIQAGPSREQVKEAQKRAESEKAQATTQPSQRQAGVPEAPLVKGGGVSCDKLNKDREDAYGRRNATVRGSRINNADNAEQVDRYQRDIQQIENQMARAGCKPT